MQSYELAEEAARLAWPRWQSKFESVGLDQQDIAAYLWDPKAALPDIQRKAVMHAKANP